MAIAALIFLILIFFSIRSIAHSAHTIAQSYVLWEKSLTPEPDKKGDA